MALYVKFECATCENENCYGHSLQTTVKVCDGYKHTATNADRIRSMTGEELAVWRASGQCPTYHYHGDYDCMSRTCEDCWLDWLKQEATP